MNKISVSTGFMYLVTLAFNIAILLWLYKLKQTNCECADNWKRTYMQYYIIYSIVFTGIILIGVLDNYKNILTPLLSVSSIAGLLYIIFGIQYLTGLRKNDCKCAKDIRETMLFYLLWIDVGMLILSALLILASFGMMYRLSRM
jgi:hypothetical protein